MKNNVIVYYSSNEMFDNIDVIVKINGHYRTKFSWLGTIKELVETHPEYKDAEFVKLENKEA